MLFAGWYVQRRCERSSGLCPWQPRLCVPDPPNTNHHQKASCPPKNPTELQSEPVRHVAPEQQTAGAPRRPQQHDAPQSNYRAQPSSCFSHVATVSAAERHLHRLDAGNLHRPGNPTEADAWCKLHARVWKSHPPTVPPLAGEHLCRGGARLRGRFWLHRGVSRQQPSRRPSRAGAPATLSTKSLPWKESGKPTLFKRRL